MTRPPAQSHAGFLNPLACWFAVASLACAGCGPGASESKMTSYTASEKKADAAQTFQIAPEQMSRVQITPALKENLPRTLRLTGAVAYNAFETAPVFSPIGGPVQRILATPGQIVSRGQPLLYVTSPDFSVSRSAYIKARDAAALADKLYARAKDLYSHGAMAEADLEQATLAQAQAHADLASATDALRVLGLKDPDAVARNSVTSTSEIPVIAPISGEVVERLVGPGQLLQAASTQCFTISNTATVWVLVNVYQNDLAFVRSGQEVEISTDAYPDAFHGKISYIAPSLDATTRTLQARIVAQNPGKKLKKDMYVTATVRAGSLQNVLTVPDDAILRDSENEPFVYVQSGPAEFSRRQVTLGESSHGRFQIKTGLREGEPVAGNGSLFLQFMNSLQH